MFYTITLNPALDRTIWVDKIEYNVSNRIHREERFPGGKGIGVSRVLARLGIYNRALGFAGGFRGAELEALLIESGIQCDFINITEETRSNIIITEEKTGRQILLASKGPQIESEEKVHLLEVIDRLENPEIVSIGGSLPAGIERDIYRTIITKVKKLGAKVILDTDGDALKYGIEGYPYAIKPNIFELSGLVGRELSTLEEIIEIAISIQKKGVDIVLVSMGAGGIILVGDRMRYLGVPPPIKVKNTIGAGDSAVAGFIYGIASGYDMENCLKYSVASGTATTLKEGTALAEKEEVMDLFPHIHFQTLD